MGKGGSKVPPPDPKLVEAQVKSMGMQDEATQEILRLAREQSAQQAELLPLQKEALQFGLESGRTAYEQAQADRAYQLAQRDKFTGLTDKMVDEATAYDSASAQNVAADAAQAGVGKAYSDALEANNRKMWSMGITPGSGRALAIREAGAADASRAGVGAANEARLVARNEGRALVDRAAAALSGSPGAASALTAQSAATGAGNVNTANAGAGGIYSGYGSLTGAQQAAGGLAGSMGANAASMYGQQQNAYVQSQNNRFNWLGGVGSLLGGAARIAPVLGVSDRRAKTDIVRVGMHPLGIGVYTFRYRPDLRAGHGDGPQIGVMADEVAAVLPGAVHVGRDGLARVDYAML